MARSGPLPAWGRSPIVCTQLDFALCFRQGPLENQQIVSVSEDYRAMTGEATFKINGGTVVVYADERVDANLLTAALKCVVYLSEVLDSVTGARRDDREAYMSDIVTLYLAARIHGVSAAGVYLVA